MKKSLKKILSPGRPVKSKSSQFWAKNRKFFFAPQPIFFLTTYVKDLKSGSLKNDLSSLSGSKINSESSLKMGNIGAYLVLKRGIYN